MTVLLAVVAALVMLLAVGGFTTMKRKFMTELAASGLAVGAGGGATVTEAEIGNLPAPVQRYLRFMGVVGRPRDTSFRAHYRARFKPRLEGGWLDAEVWQFNSAPDVARLFYMTLRFGHVVPVLGRDTYVRGEGRMLIRPLDLFTVEDSRGREMDIGELVTYLNDAVLLAPSMLLAPAVTFAAVDDDHFDVTLADRGARVTARVEIDALGAPRNFTTEDRFFNKVQTRWSTPVGEYVSMDGHMLPESGQAVWHFATGDFAYGDFRFEPGDFVFNVAPRE